MMIKAEHLGEKKKRLCNCALVCWLASILSQVEKKIKYKYYIYWASCNNYDHHRATQKNI